jgi:hypothetical protein
MLTSCGTSRRKPPFTGRITPTTGQQPPEPSRPTAYVAVSPTGKNWRLDYGPPGRRRVPYRSREGGSEAVAIREAKSDPRTVVPAPVARRAGRSMARPLPGRWKTGDRGHPRRLSDTHGMHSARGYRVRMNAEHATSLAGFMACARTRYRLAGPRSAGEKLPAGMRGRLAVPR